MKNWCICWFFMHFLMGILIFKGFTARRLNKSFDVKGLKVEGMKSLPDKRMYVKKQVGDCVVC
jgi:hypothetical protein